MITPHLHRYALHIVLWATLPASLSACSSESQKTADASPRDLARKDATVADQTPLVDGPPLGDGGPVTFAELCERRAALVCAPVVKCCKTVAPAAADLEACKATVRRLCIDGGAKEAAALARGEASIDDVRLASCEAVGRQAAEQCRVASQPDEVQTCSGVVMANANLGTACGQGLSGARCANNQGICFAEPTGITCKAFSQEGTLCSVAPCAPHLLCMLDIDPFRPAVCDSPRPAGEPCRADVHCASGLACFDQKCAAALGSGQGCKNSSKCLPHLMCDPLTETCGAKRKQGEPCYLGSHCTKGLACTEVKVGNVCVPGTASDGGDAPGLPTLGQRCSDGCARGLRCTEGPIAGECLPTLCVAVLETTG